MIQVSLFISPTGFITEIVMVSIATLISYPTYMGALSIIQYGELLTKNHCDLGTSDLQRLLIVASPDKT